MSAGRGTPVRRVLTRTTAVVAGLALAVGLAGPASGDDVVNSLDASVDATAEQVSVPVGTSVPVKLSIVPTGGDGKNGCNLTGGTSLTVAVSSSTVAATVEPGSVTFASCGDTPTLTVRGVSGGTAVVTLTQTSNTSGGTFNFAPATFQVNVPTPCVAPAAPALSPLSAAGASGWYSEASGQAGFTVTPAAGAQYSLDAGSTWTPYTAPVVLGADGVVTAVARTVTTPAGCPALTSPTSAELVQRVDRTAPTAGVQALPEANAAGWNAEVVEAVWTCADSGSGLTANACPSTETFGNGSHEPARTITVTDVAGNPTEVTRRAVLVDTEAPVVTAEVPEPSGRDGWDSAGFAVTYGCTDGGGSGVVECPAAEALTVSGSPYAARDVVVSDLAGNTSSTFTRREVKIDATAPSAVVTLSPVANENGWHRGGVTATYTCSDEGGSGVSWCPDPEELVEDGLHEAQEIGIEDDALNPFTVVRPEVRIDTVAPYVDYAITDADGVAVQPSESGWYLEPVLVRFECWDDEDSGHPSGVVTGGTFACPEALEVGAEGTTPAQTFAVQDAAGNETTVTVPEIRIDTIAPELSVVVSPEANAAGWNNGPVTVTWSCSDAGSGVQCPQDEVVEAGELPAETLTVTDVAGNVSDAVERRAIKVDADAPQVELRLLAGDQPVQPNGNGWFHQEVTVDVTCQDDASGVVPESCPAPVTFSDGVFGGYDVVVADAAGNATTVAVPELKVDTTAPTLSVEVSPAANAAGWNRGPVTIDVTCADDGPTVSGTGSGVADCPADRTVESGTLAEEDLVVTDLAGNESAPVTRRAVHVDQVNPVVAVAVLDGSGEPALANENGWYREQLTLDVTCSDEGGSGLVESGAGQCPGDEQVGDGVHPERTFESSDLAGNAGRTTVPELRVDTVAPEVTDLGASAEPTGTDGWYRTPVTVRFGLADGLSGFVGSDDPHVREVTTTGEGSALTVSSGAAQDKAGNTTAALLSGPFKVDLAAPTGVTFVGGPATGSAYPAGSVPAAPTCTADGGVSGLASCTVSGHSTAVGAHTLTATAVDGAGWTSTATLTYRVTYRTTGFYQPVDMGVMNTVKGGSTVPLKFEVFDATSEVTTTSAVSSIRYKETACGAFGNLPEDAIETLATGGTTLRYDSTAGQFVYNWQTPKTIGKCYTTSVVLVDGSTLTAWFKTK